MADRSPKKLKDVLATYSGLTGPLGETTAINVEAMKRDLAKLDRYLQFHYRVMLALFVSIFLIGIVVTLVFITSPERASAVIAVIGLGAGGAAVKLNDTGREIANLRLVVVLASAFNTDQMTLVVQALASRLSK